MAPARGFFGVLLLLSFSIFTSSKGSKENTSNVLRFFMSNLISRQFPNHRIFFIQDWTSKNNRTLPFGFMNEVISDEKIISQSGGIQNVQLSSNKEFSIFSRLSERTNCRAFSETTQIVVIVLPDGIKGESEEEKWKKSLNFPLLSPPTTKNRDKFIIIAGKSEKDMNKKNTLLSSNFIEKLKFKLFINVELNVGVHIHQYCSHCPIPERVRSLISSKDVASADEVTKFPDFHCNFYGKVVKASATPKMRGDFEFGKNPETGKYFAKRGVFASVLFHLASGLNFTPEVNPSSGGGSTGTRLPNATWIGAVGDVYNGDATFCMACSMSEERHTVIDMCSPISHGYIKFAHGPPRKVYTWLTIFWPFKVSLWIAIMATTLICISASALILRVLRTNDLERTNWNAMTVAQYFAKVFVEQAEELPNNLPQSLRIILGFWLIWALVGATLYRAKMTTLMTFPVYGYIPDTFAELVNSDFKMDFHYFPNVAYNMLKVSTNPVLKKVYENMGKEPDLFKCLTKTLESKSTCIIFTTIYNDMINRNFSDAHGRSQISTSTGYAYSFSPGIVTEKHADIYDNFKHILVNSISMGLVEGWLQSDKSLVLQEVNAWKRKAKLDQNEHMLADSTDDNLTLKNLIGAFVVYFVGIISATFGFLWEYKYNLRRMIVLWFMKIKEACKNVGAKDCEFHECI